MQSYIADALYQYAVNRLSQEQIKEIHTEEQLFATMEDDDIEEIKEELWRLVRYERWSRLMQMIRDLVEESDEEEDYEKESDDSE